MVQRQIAKLALTDQPEPLGLHLPRGYPIHWAKVAGVCHEISPIASPFLDRYISSQPRCALFASSRRVLRLVLQNLHQSHYVSFVRLRRASNCKTELPHVVAGRFLTQDTGRRQCRTRLSCRQTQLLSQVPPVSPHPTLVSRASAKQRGWPARVRSKTTFQYQIAACQVDQDAA